ncbi:MAG TPA: thiamine pyrophosphate-binding protein [Pyrinomonadaceae bacterium]|nr:thiamine pyrophosphate-binding protein [Pyrinomonadaceae bacterium]
MEGSLMNGAELLTRELSRLGVKHVFGFPGESTLPLAVALTKPQMPSHVIAGCEKCAGYMADGYARFSDRLAACYSPGGIGSPLLLPSLLEAHNSSIPLLFISISEATHKLGKWSTSSFDHSAFNCVVKANFRVDRIERLVSRTREAVRLAATPRTGPCHLDIPYDVLTASYEVQDAGQSFAPEAVYPRHRIRADENTIRRVRQLIERARSPLMILGGGVQLARVQAGLITQFAELYDVRLVSTLNGKGAVHEVENSRFLGVIGQKGRSDINKFVRGCDLVMLLGTKMGDKSSLNWTLLGSDQSVIQVDVDPAEIGRNFNVREGVLSDAEAFLEDMIAAGANQAERGPRSFPDLNAAPPASGLIPRMCSILSGKLEGEDLLIADASQACGWMGSYFRPTLRSRGTASPRGTGSIGFALPAAIGAATARPKSCIAVIGGDGGLLMSMHEMETAARLGIKLRFFLLNNNNRLGLLENHLEHLYGVKGALGQRNSVDWQLICNAFRWDYLAISSESEMEKTIDTAFASSAPVLVDVKSDDQLSPDFQNTLSVADRRLRE